MSFIKYSTHAFGHVCVVYMFCWRSHLLALCHRREKAAESRQLVSSKQPVDPIRLGMKISFYLLPFSFLFQFLFFLSPPFMPSSPSLSNFHFVSNYVFYLFLLTFFFKVFSSSVFIGFLSFFFFLAFPARNPTLLQHQSRLQLLYLP